MLIERILAFKPTRGGYIAAIPPDQLVEEIPEEGTVRFLDSSLVSSHEKARKYPVEAEYQDIDLVPVRALLFTRADKVYELEVYKADSTPIQYVALPHEWQLLDEE